MFIVYKLPKIIYINAIKTYTKTDPDINKNKRRHGNQLAIVLQSKN